MSIVENFKNIQNYTSDARIIAVTKYVTVNRVIEAYELGIRDFGENKAQDAEEKRALLPGEIEKNVIWHFLGHLQTNKIKKVVGRFDYIHSVDSLKLLEAIDERASSLGIVQKLFIQVNISGEESKFGLSAKEAEEIFSEINSFTSVKVVGLMTMAPFTADSEEQRLVFKGLRELRDEIQNKFNVQILELSMGMSNDYKIAVEEGATMVRIGNAIFK